MENADKRSFIYPDNCLLENVPLAVLALSFLPVTSPVWPWLAGDPTFVTPPLVLEKPLCGKAFLPRSKLLLISWLQALSISISEPKKIKSVTASTFYPSICHGVMGPEGASQMAPSVKNLPANAGETGNTGSIPGSERSPGEGNGNPL